MRLPFIEAGQIVTTHGVRGELKVLPWSDGPDFLLDFHRVLIDGQAYKIERCRIQKSCNILKLYGVDTMEAAQQLRGKTLLINREDVSDNVIFAAELLDVEVFCDGVFVGKITDVLDYPGNKVYVVTGEHEYMIPAVREFVLSVDIDKNTMQVRMIEGMGTHEN